MSRSIVSRSLVRIGLWLALLVVCAVIAARADYTTDLSAFLPAAPTENQQLLVDQLRSGPVSRLLLLGIESTGADADDPAAASTRARLSKALAPALRGAPGIGAVTNGAITGGDDPGQKLLFDYRYLVGDAVEAGRLAMPGLEAALRDGLETLASPLGLVYRELFTRDPTGEMLRLVDRMQPSRTPRVIDGVWASDDGRRAILLVRLDADGTALDRQQAALQEIQRAFERIRGEVGAQAGAQAGAAAAARLVMTGTARFSVESRDTIEGDVKRLSLLGTLAIVLLLLSVYRSPRPLLLGLLPVASGIVVAIAAVAVVFGQVHAITLGFGVALIGEGIDYAIYLFVQGSSPSLWRTVRLGVLTSLIGFSSLLASSFPGLAQLGVFAVTGILVAAVVSRFVLAPLVGGRPVGLPGWLVALARQLPRLRRLRAVPVIAAVASALVIATITARHPLWQSNLESLSPITTADQRLDQELRSALRAPDVRHVIAVRAATEDEALALAERVEQRLGPLLADGTLGGLQSPATWLAPASRQRERLAALPARDRLIADLARATEGLPVRAERLLPFVDDVDASRALSPLTAADLGSSELSLAVTTLLVESGNGVTAMLPLQATGADGLIDDASVRRQLFDTAPSLASLPGGSVHLLDLKAETDGLYGAYLKEALILSALGGLLIATVLAVALRAQGARGARDTGGIGDTGEAVGWAGVVRVLLPLLAAELTVVAMLTLAGVPLTLLHLVGLLLTVAVGSNYTLFFAGRQDDERILSSLLLANITTALAFGVLGFATAPVLAAIGQTVGPGAILSLLFGAMASASSDAPGPSAAGPSAAGPSSVEPSSGEPSAADDRWRPSPLIRWSFRLHALVLLAAAVLLVARPAGWPIGIAALLVAIALNHILLTATGLWPRSRGLGPNLTDFHGDAAAAGRIVLTIDDGPDPAVTPAVLDVLAAHGARASFFLIGVRARAHPDLVRRIAAEGHGIENHSFRHDLKFSLRGMRWLGDDIDAAQRTLAELGGRSPRFFRAPAGLRSPLLDPVLARARLRLASWTRRGFDTCTADPARVLERLAGRDGERLAAGDILLVHDGHAARDAAGRPVILPVLEQLLPLCRRRGFTVVSLDDVVPRRAVPRTG